MSGLSQYQNHANQHDTAARGALLEAHLPLVKFTAERLAAKLPTWVELDDLVGAGVLGLMDAVDKFDTAKGVLFKTYAELRIRGAILDSLRDLDWAPRSMRRRAREVEAAFAQVERTRGHANEEDVASVLKMSLPEFQRLMQELRTLTITGLENSDDEENANAARQLPADPSPTPLAMYETQEVRRHLSSAIDKLSERERQVVALYYVEELTMKEIGAVLGITESRVSQLRTQAVIRLRGSLSAVRSNLAVA
ncbi:MAG TPA: FliA/WhiG family RNA polymerase sigma factor [Pyrinomonadaceae bacterium]|nr:FliA/WhiG family RNA polymerase sigma factor [Pyrinomonadaceae bacterium]